MTRTEAITLQDGCSSIAKRLDVHDVNIELTEADRAALEGFNQVWLYKDGYWLADPDIHRQAGLGRDDINALSFMAAQVQPKEMRRQRTSGDLGY